MAPPAALATASGVSRGLLWLALLVVVAIAGALGLRFYLRQSALREAGKVASAALARDTFGGFRDADRALRPLVGPHSRQTELLVARSYALAQLAARYGDDQAAVDSELLNNPLERALQGGMALPPRFFAARALLLLGNGEPGSALLTLSASPPQARSPELAVVRAQVFEALEKPAEAKAALAEALAQVPPALEALLAAAQAADRAGDPARAAALAQQALGQNPDHWPSLLLLADLARQSKAIEPTQVRSALRRAEPSLAAEASPGEQCRARYAMAELELQQGELARVTETLDRGADLDEAPPACRADLARLELRLGRDAQALTLLAAAAADENPKSAALDYAELLRDPALALAQAQKPPPPELLTAAAARFQARAEAIRLTAALDLGQRKQAGALAARLEGWEIPQVQTSLARYRAVSGDAKAAGKLMGQAILSAQKTATPGDDLARVGEQANSLLLWTLGVSACAAAAARGPANYRALLCEAQALKGLHRSGEALAASERALAINPSGAAANRLHAELSPAAAEPALPPLSPVPLVGSGAAGK